MNKITKLFAQIEKVLKRDDGTIDVFGFASSEAVDADGEIITSDAMREALPDYMVFGNVREMHDSTKAAGVAFDASVLDDGKTYFAVHVVDPVAILKVESGVYKGFSIAGKVLKRDGFKITALRLIEVSLVDRPSNPEAVFTFFKTEKLEVEQEIDMSEKDIETQEVVKLEAAKDLDEKSGEPTVIVDELKESSDTNNDFEKRLVLLEDSIKKAESIIAEQAKRIEELEKEPEPAKAIAKVISKEEDSTNTKQEFDPLDSKNAIKKAHQAGGFKIL